MARRPNAAEARRTAWRKVSTRIGEDFLARRHQRPDIVQLKHGDSIITLDAMDGPEDELERQMRRLQGPGGVVTGRVTLWGGGPPRIRRGRGTRAARRRSCGGSALEHAARERRRPAGEDRAVPALIRLLGRRQGQPNHKLCDYAAQALISLGEEETVSAFADALEGRLEARTNLPRPAPALEPRADTLPKPADGAALPTTGILPKATDL